MDRPLYFYRKTIPPEQYDYYDYSLGIVGYKSMKPHSGMPLICHGTVDELNIYLEKNPRATRRVY